MIDLDIRVERGRYTLEARLKSDSRVTGLIGPSGSGKTTMLNVMLGVVKPAAGRVGILGDRVLFDSTNRVNVPMEKRRLGVVFQDNLLFPNLSVRGNLTFGYERIAPAERRLSPDEICRLLDLGPLLDRGVSELSGGEARRVAIGRALLASPSMLLLDEPLTGLDVNLRDKVLAYLLRLKKDLSIPMVFVSHRFADISALADSVALLEVENHEGGRKFSRVASLGEPNAVIEQAEKVVSIGPIETIIPGRVIETQAGADYSLIQGEGIRMQVSPDHKQPGLGCFVTLRADEVILSRERPPALSSRNVWKGRVARIQNLEHTTVVMVDVGHEIAAEVTRDSIRELGIQPGVEVYAIVKAKSLRTVQVGEK